MAAVDISLDGACSGGGHLIVGVAVDGVARAKLHITKDDLAASVSDQDIHNAALTFLRLSGGGDAGLAFESLQKGVSLASEVKTGEVKP